MTLQRRLLLLMLASLGVAALTGILAVLGGNSEILGRLALSGLWFGIGLAVALAASRWLKKESTQRAALLSIALVSLAVVIAFGATWAEMFGLGWRATSRLAGTAALVFFAGQAAAIAFAFSANATMRFASRVVLVCIPVGCLPMLLLIWDLLPGWPNENRLAGSAALCWGAMPPLFACLAGFPGRVWHWRWVGIGAVAVGWPLAFYGIWNDFNEPPTVFLECIIIAITVSLANIAQFPVLPGKWYRLRLVSVISVLVSAGFFSYINLLTNIWKRQTFNDEPLIALKFAGVFAIVGVAGVASLYIVERLTRRPSGVRVAELTGITALHVTCPRCQKAQDAPIGSSRCQGCGVVLTVGVSEPRCPQCEYALLDIVGDRCPECGLDLPRRGEVMKLPSKE